MVQRTAGLYKDSATGADPIIRLNIELFYASKQLVEDSSKLNFELLQEYESKINYLLTHCHTSKSFNVISLTTLWRTVSNLYMSSDKSFYFDKKIIDQLLILTEKKLFDFRIESLLQSFVQSGLSWDDLNKDLQRKILISLQVTCKSYDLNTLSNTLTFLGAMGVKWNNLNSSQTKAVITSLGINLPHLDLSNISAFLYAIAFLEVPWNDIPTSFATQLLEHLDKELNLTQQIRRIDARQIETARICYQLKISDGNLAKIKKALNISYKGRSSKSHIKIAKIMTELTDSKIENEVPICGGYVDIAVGDKLFEYYGPCHYNRKNQLNAKTAFRQQLFAKEQREVHTICYKEWDKAEKAKTDKSFVAELLQLANIPLKKSYVVDKKTDKKAANKETKKVPARIPQALFAGKQVVAQLNPLQTDNDVLKWNTMKLKK